ncbi:hypothetical protein AMECASPLE_010835 [Ameca splendens]|uniref:Uncharacterized protein n=1 Tax=Ameca splendens TaxID=208324 RepID=A0ABV0ZAD9_9TELE
MTRGGSGPLVRYADCFYPQLLAEETAFCGFHRTETVLSIRHVAQYVLHGVRVWHRNRSIWLRQEVRGFQRSSVWEASLGVRKGMREAQLLDAERKRGRREGGRDGWKK